MFWADACGHIPTERSQGTMESNASYFGRRAREELFAAIRADHHKARRAHLDLAARYDDLARSIEARESWPESKSGTALPVEAEQAAERLALSV